MSKITKNKISGYELRLFKEPGIVYTLRSSNDVYLFVKEELAKNMKNLANERFYYLGLNAKNEIIMIDYFEGDVAESRVYIAHMTKKILLTNASQVMLVHNHPSGNIKESDADILITNRIKEALGLFDIRILDHIIVGDNDFLSFREKGLL